MFMKQAPGALYLWQLSLLYQIYYYCISFSILSFYNGVMFDAINSNKLSVFWILYFSSVCSIAFATPTYVLELDNVHLSVRPSVQPVCQHLYIYLGFNTKHVVRGTQFQHYTPAFAQSFCWVMTTLTQLFNHKWRGCFPLPLKAMIPLSKPL